MAVAKKKGPEVSDLVARVVRRVVDQEIEVIEAVDLVLARCFDDLPRATLHALTREGLRSFSHEKGVRSYRRTGKIQSSRTHRSAVPEEEEGAVDFAVAMLGRLVFETVDGKMKSVLSFTADDARAQYDRRVRRPREQAEREEPFWTEAIVVAEGSGTIADAPPSRKAKLAHLALAANLTEAAE